MSVRRYQCEKKTLFVWLTLLISFLAGALPAFSGERCTYAPLGYDEPAEYRPIDVVYQFSQTPVYADTAFDARCRYFSSKEGQRMCEIRMVGTLYIPKATAYQVAPGQPPAQFPALIMNHGSENGFTAHIKWCDVANFFVPKGYIVFAPFRRGQGECPQTPERCSSGIDVDDYMADWSSQTNHYPHNTSCPDGNIDCYLSELMPVQAHQEMRAAMEFLEARSDVRKMPPGSPNADDWRIAIMGGSYGGRATVYANELELGQLASVAIAPGAEGGFGGDCLTTDLDCGDYSRRSLMAAARLAKRPTYYLQAQWDVDTRVTLDLAWAQATATSPNDTHHLRPFMASIFNYPSPCAEQPCSDDDYLKVHGDFFHKLNLWGPSVRNFLKRMNVK